MWEAEQTPCAKRQRNTPTVQGGKNVTRRSGGNWRVIMFANRAGVEDRTTILASLRALISRLGLTDAEFLSLAANVVAQELPPPANRGPSARTPTRQGSAPIDDNGWNEEHEFRSWRKLFEIEMEERLVRAHKDYNESVQSGLNSAVQLLSAIVTGLGTVSLVLFSTTREEYVLHNSSTAASDVEVFERKLGDTGIFSVRWWFDIAITLASLLATGLSGVAGRRATRTGELTRQCEAFMNSRQDLIKRYRQALEAPLADRKSYKDFCESVRDLETREDQFVGRTLSNTQRFFALYTIRLWDHPAYHRYFRFCVVCALPPLSSLLALPLVMRRSDLSPRASQTKTAISVAVSASTCSTFCWDLSSKSSSFRRTASRRRCCFTNFQASSCAHTSATWSSNLARTGSHQQRWRCDGNIERGRGMLLTSRI